MMASRKGSTGGMRAPRRTKKKAGINPYLILLVGVVAVAVIAIVVIAGGRKAPPKKKAETSQVESGGKRSRRDTKQRGRELSRRARKEQREKEREARRRARRSGSGTRRGERKSGGSRVKTSSSYRLEAILVDRAGERRALIGARQYGAGEDVAGRRILQVGSDEIQVEYSGKTYTVRIGQAVY